MQVADPGTVLGDFDGARFAQGAATARFNRRGDAFFVTTAGPDGEEQEFRIAYTFGVEPLQQYLIGFPDGRYQAFDIAWDGRPEEDGGQRWFYLRPGERVAPGDPVHWTGVAYNWNSSCADCHSTGVEKNYDLATDTYETTFREVDVSCEACHGPGSAHVAWAENRLAPEGPLVTGENRASRGGTSEGGAGRGAAVSTEAASTVVSTAAAAAARAARVGLQVGFPRLADHSWDIDPETGLAERNPAAAPSADVDACGRCHARRSRIAEEHRQGAPLTAFYRPALLEQGLYHADGQILEEVFVYGSFLQSRMYQAGVGCIDCHAPHGLEPYNQGNALCSRCHLAARFDAPEHHHHQPGSPGAQCVACHMPATTYMVVDPRRDHSFPLPRPDSSLAYGTPNACADCHAERGDRWAADAIEGWFGPERPASDGARLAAARDRDRRAEPDRLALATDSEVPGITRATALSLLQPTSPASIAAISRGLQSGEPLVRIGALIGLDGADPTTILRLALPMLEDDERAVRLEATRLAAVIPPPQIPPARRGTVARALDEYRAAQRVSEDRAPAHVNLGWLAMQQGDAAAAERAYRTAMRLEPTFIPAYVNLVELYRSTGRDAEGEELLRRALAIDPASGAVHHALGLLLVRLERRAEAVEALRRAAELTPDNPRYRYVHAVAVHSVGEEREALRILDETLVRFPADRELLFAAATFSRDLGEIDRAIGYARRLVELDPADRQAAALLRELESRRSPS